MLVRPFAVDDLVGMEQDRALDPLIVRRCEGLVGQMDAAAAAEAALFIREWGEDLPFVEKYDVRDGNPDVVCEVAHFSLARFLDDGMNLGSDMTYASAAFLRSLQRLRAFANLGNIDHIYLTYENGFNPEGYQHDIDFRIATLHLMGEKETAFAETREGFMDDRFVQDQPGDAITVDYSSDTSRSPWIRSDYVPFQEHIDSGMPFTIELNVLARPT